MDLALDRSKKGFLVKPIILLITLLVSSQLNLTSVSASPEYQDFNREEFKSLLSNIDQFPSVKNEPLIINSKAHLLLDIESGEILTENNGFLQLPVASTTKMLTALLAIEKLALEKEVLVSNSVLPVIGSKINLRPNESFSVEDLLYALMLNSANDAAVVLAEAYTQETGNIDGFVESMNRFLLEHNLNNSIYNDPAGLDDEYGRSTPFELAQTARLVLSNPTLSKIVSTRTHTITSLSGRTSHQLRNTNRLLHSDSGLFYPNASGIKTGFTFDSGYCLVASTTINGRKVIGVVLNTNEFHPNGPAREMLRLFRWAERNVTVKSY